MAVAGSCHRQGQETVKGRGQASVEWVKFRASSVPFIQNRPMGSLVSETGMRPLWVEPRGEWQE